MFYSTAPWGLHHLPPHLYYTSPRIIFKEQLWLYLQRTLDGTSVCVIRLLYSFFLSKILLSTHVIFFKRILTTFLIKGHLEEEICGIWSHKEHSLMTSTNQSLTFQNNNSYFRKLAVGTIQVVFKYNFKDCILLNNCLLNPYIFNNTIVSYGIPVTYSTENQWTTALWLGSSALSYRKKTANHLLFNSFQLTSWEK